LKKVIVCGPYNAGKTSFIKNVNPQTFTGTEEREFDLRALKELPTTTTVGVEVNFLSNGEKEVMFVGLPGQDRFDFLWEVVGEKFDGILFLTPSYATLREISSFIDFFSRFPSFKGALKKLVVTYPEKLSPSKLQIFSLLGFPVEVLDPTKGEDVKKFSLKLLEEI